MTHWTERHRVLLAIYAVLRNDQGKILMLRRANTGYMDGKLSLPAGHVDGGEAADAALVRETKEEIGIELSPKDIRLVHTIHRQAEEGGYEYVDLYFEVMKWRGEPKNMEPGKCSELPWVDSDHLPDDVIPVVRQALTCIAHGQPYSHFNF